MPDPTITLRLLAAARHAYEVDADGVVPNQGWPPDPYGFIRYTDQPIGFRAGADNQDGGFVATIPEPTTRTAASSQPFRRASSSPSAARRRPGCSAESPCRWWWTGRPMLSRPW